VGQWREAFTTFGFAQVVGHGVPDAAIEDVYRAARAFFAQPPEAKRKCDLGKGYGFGGYSAQGVERVSATASSADGSSLLGAAKARPPDRVESMVVHKQPADAMPENVVGFRDATYQYHDEMRTLLGCLMSLTACALGLPPRYFEPYFDCRGHELSLRLAYYPAFPDGTDVLPGQLRYGEHTDYTGFTILWQDHNRAGPQLAADAVAPAGGLQVQMPDGSWADCPPVPGAFTINSGDLIQVWTNDVFLSNTHRVLNPPPDDRDDRISVVFFTGPSDKTVISCLPTCCGHDRPAKYGPITAGEHLLRKITASNK